MNVTSTGIDGVLVIEPKVFGDERGFFLESYNAKAFEATIGATATFVQDNHSRSRRGVLRGLHWQDGDAAQGKLVRATSGAVFDVAVDVRPDSPTFGRWFGLELSGDNHLQMWIAPGLAHGFLVVSEMADFVYKTTTYYEPAAERTLHWNDPDLAIAWPDVGLAPIVSAKDAAGIDFAAMR